MPRLRLAILDVDGTLKEAESPYQYLHAHLGVAHLAAENRSLALAGEIGYAEWLRRDVLLWAGQPVSDLRRLLEQNPYVPGAPELLRALKQAGVTVALVSVGFTLNTDPIMETFNLDYSLANELTVVNGILTGEALNRVPEGGKALFARELMARLNIPSEQTLAAGDTRGDLELFDCAGLCIAVNPRDPALREQADVVFEPDLTGAVDWLKAHGYLP